MSTEINAGGQAQSEMELSNNQEEEQQEIDELQITFDALEDAEEEAKAKIGSVNISLAAEYEKIILSPRTDDAALKIKEASIYKLARIFTELSQYSDVMSLIQRNSSYFSLIPKARTAKIVRSILDIVSSSVTDSSSSNLEVQVNLCQQIVDWCKEEKRTFLRQRIEAKLAALLLQQKAVTESLAIINSLLGELKKLDDKQMLTETHLTESKIYLAMQNVPKSKASLTASRTNATSIYVTPLLQAEIDEMSGMLHVEEHDYITAFSYFLEAYEAFDQTGDKRAVKTLAYMVLCKVLAELPGEVPAILAGKHGLKYAGLELQAMAAVAKAAKARSLEDFTTAVNTYESFLKSDELFSRRLEMLYDTMLETNLLKIINPFSCVEIDHVASLIKLPVDQVERKLSQMILDKRFAGILDQGKGHLIVYESSSEDSNFARGLEIIANMSLSVDALSQRAKRLGTATADAASPANASSGSTKPGTTPGSPSKSSPKKDPKSP